jgi:hypothetical protein
LFCCRHGTLLPENAPRYTRVMRLAGGALPASVCATNGIVY